MSAGAAQSQPRLTSFARGAGCGCKLPAAELHALLGDLPAGENERVLVGFRPPTTRRWSPSHRTWRWCRPSTSSPRRRDPSTFGAIAAANALSDVYAMGGRPISALSILAFPLERLGGEILRAIMAGALETLGRAAVPLVGGHSIDDPEPKFGLAVTGTIDPSRILRNAGARPGDALVLTKPLGTGVIAPRPSAARSRPPTGRGGGGDGELNDAAGGQAVAAGAHAAPT